MKAPYYSAPDLQMYVGDVREVLRGLKAESVHCAVCSPPYFSLRSYLPVDHPNKAQELGSEATPEEYVANMVDVFREVKRVLRKEATLWLNLAPTYAGSGKGAWSNKTAQKETYVPDPDEIAGAGKVPTGYKPKDLIPVDWLVAMALQRDGWWLRSAITWCKNAPMPSSATDRPTNATETIFLLSKSANYYYDAVAVAEPAKYAGDNRGARGDSRRGTECNSMSGVTGQTRNMWNWWALNPDPFTGGDHYATYPGEIPKRAILAGTSEAGCCSAMVKKLQVKKDLTHEQRQRLERWLKRKDLL